MMRATISPLQQQRTQRQLIDAVTIRAAKESQEISSDVAGIKQSVDGIDIGSVNEQLEALNERVGNLEGAQIP